MTGSPRIRRRLTAWYAGSVLVLLLSAVLFMRAWAQRTLATQIQEANDRSVELVQSFFRTEYDEYRDITGTLAHIAGEFVFAGMRVEFLKPDGGVYAIAQPHRGAPPPRPPVRLVVEPLDPKRAPGWRVRLALSSADLVAALTRIDRLTLAAIPLAVALAALTGWLVTERALRPVGLMADAAERISADRTSGQSFPGRLPVADPNDEFGRLGRRFNELLDRLEGTLAQQRRFLTDAAHELRTPIARMLGEAESHLVSAPSADQDRTALRRIRDDLHGTSSLVDELMQLARADAGSVDALLAPAYLDDVIVDALPTWSGEAKRRGIALDIEALEETPASLDARLIARLFGVLVDNALRYTPSGGSIGVRVVMHDGAATLEVHDSGIGIPAAERPHVFERFFRGSRAREREPNGSGLGLAIAHWIAQQHGAAIAADVGPRGGALIRVSFPPRERANGARADAHADGARTARASSKGSLRGAGA